MNPLAHCSQVVSVQFEEHCLATPLVYPVGILPQFLSAPRRARAGSPGAQRLPPPGFRDFTLLKTLYFVLFNMWNVDFVVSIMILKVSSVSLPGKEQLKFRIRSTQE